MTPRWRALVLAGLLAGFAPASAGRAEPTSTTFRPPVGGQAEDRRALVCRPKGDGPFPAVVFNHGSIVDGWGLRERLGVEGSR